MAVRRWLLLLTPCVAYVAAVIALLGADRRALNALLPITVVALNLIGFALSLVAATRRRLPRRARRPWWLMALSFLLFLAAGAAFGYAAGNGLDSLTMLAPEVVVAVGLRLAMAGAMLAALLSFAAAPLTRRGVLKVALDATTVVGGGSMAMWYLIIGPAVESGTPAASIALTSAVTVSDLVLILGVCAALLRGVSAVARRPVSILIIGILGSLGSDLYLALDPAQTLTGWVCIVMVTPVFLLALAAADQSGAMAAPAGDARPQPFRLRVVAPYLGLAVGFGVLAVAAAHSGLFWVGLVGGAAVMILGVVGRQIVALRENHDLVLTDGLTGLANRTRFEARLDDAVRRSRRTAQPVAVLLLDLDDFKQVNDRLGHQAGDTLLVAFGAVLRASVGAGHTVARLGGDEFAVLLDRPGGAADAMAAGERILAGAAAAEVRHRDETLTVRVSVGVAVATFRGGEIDDGAALLHRADLAMYAEKRQGTHGCRLYTAEVPALVGQ